MDHRPKLLVVIASTRPGRVGFPVAEWFLEQARAFGGFDVQMADLAELDLPLMNEPHHPRLRQYAHDHTRRWSEMVDASDAFVLVMPEYNHGFTAPLKNALDYLFHEWAHKPVGFVSYGGIAAGTRAVQLLKPVLVALKLTPIVEAVNIAWVTQHIHDGTFRPEASIVRAAEVMLDELQRTASALRVMRTPVASTPR